MHASAERAERRPRRRQLELPGSRLRRRRPRHPDRQHRRRPPDRLGRRVQQLPRAVLAVRDRHRQPPERPGAARVPLRALAQPGRRPDARDRHGRRPGPQRRARRRARPRHGSRTTASGSSRPAARPTRRPATSRAASATCCAAPTSTTARCRRFAVDSGAWTVARRPAPGRSGLAGQGRDRRLLRRRVPADLLRDHAPRSTVQKPTGGWKANAYVLFDYWSPTDFKFAGIDDSTNKLVIGHARRHPAGTYDTLGLDPGRREARHVLQPDDRRQRDDRHRHGERLVAQLHLRAADAVRSERQELRPGRPQQGPRRLRLEQLARRHGQRRRLVGLDGQHRRCDRVLRGRHARSVHRPVERHLDARATAATSARPPRARTSSRRPIYGTTIHADLVGDDRRDAEHDRDGRHRVRRLRRERLQVRRRSTSPASGSMSATSTSAATGSSTTRSRRRSSPAPTTRSKSSSRTRSPPSRSNGNVLGSWMFNAAVADGKTGLVTRGGTTSVDQYEFRTDDPFFLTAPPQPTGRAASATSRHGRQLRHDPGVDHAHAAAPAHGRDDDRLSHDRWHGHCRLGLHRCTVRHRDRSPPVRRAS